MHLNSRAPIWARGTPISVWKWGMTGSAMGTSVLLAVSQGPSFYRCRRESGTIEGEAAMPRVLYERDGRIARLTLNRPEVLNAIDDELPIELEAAVEQANADPKVHGIVLARAGGAFCAGYDLKYYAQAAGPNAGVQAMPWDPMQDYAFMMRNTERFMALFR